MSVDAPRFSSDRERRLWVWTLAAVVAIYSTLGLARTMVDALRDHNLLRISFALGVFLVAVPVAWKWVKRRPDRGEIGVALGVAFTYWMVAIRIDSWEERTHLIEYGVVAALIHQALIERAGNGRQVPAPAALALVLTASLGSLDEIIQFFMPSRVFDVRDVLFNALAGFMVIAARLSISPQPRPGWRVWFLWLWAAAIGWGQGVYWGWYSDDEPKLLETTPDVILSGYLGLVVGAFLIAVLQWFVLRSHVARAWQWILATFVAATVVGVIIFVLGVVDEDLGWMAGVIAFGTLLGVAQWAMLRRHVPRAGWWVLASTTGWIVGMPLGDVGGPPGLGAAYGAITATALVWLLRQPPSKRMKFGVLPRQ